MEASRVSGIGVAEVGELHGFRCHNPKCENMINRGHMYWCNRTIKQSKSSNQNSTVGCFQQISGEGRGFRSEGLNVK